MRSSVDGLGQWVRGRAVSSLIERALAPGNFGERSTSARVVVEVGRNVNGESLRLQMRLRRLRLRLGGGHESGDVVGPLGLARVC
jgi:hypothetical protein